MNYRKLNCCTKNDHFPMPFTDRMFDRLAALEDQEKTTFTFPYRTSAFKRMPFCFSNALVAFQHCLMSIFSDIGEDTIE
uniref:Uncharacterized protein n=1 Tax=Solanum lycopersicum TaxID=4081 RepID=A0A3Q7GST0_SOLLC